MAGSAGLIEAISTIVVADVVMSVDNACSIGFGLVTTVAIMSAAHYFHRHRPRLRRHAPGE